MLTYPISDVLKNALLRATRATFDGTIFEELLSAVASMFPAKRFVTVAADTTVVPEDNRTLFRASAAVNFTLPAPVLGLSYRFFQASDNNLVVTCTGLLLADGNVVANTCTFSTASHKKGSHILVEAVNDGGTLKWLVANLGGTTMTVA